MLYYSRLVSIKLGPPRLVRDACQSLDMKYTDFTRMDRDHTYQCVGKVFDREFNDNDRTADQECTFS